MQYTVKDVLGNNYVWTGDDAAQIGNILSYADGLADTDVTMLHCDGDVFVNIDHVVSLTPRVSTPEG